MQRRQCSVRPRSLFNPKVVKFKGKRYYHRLNKVRWNWRWYTKYPPDDWTIIGVSQWWFSPLEYRYTLCFFGLDLQFWFKREFHGGKWSQNVD